MRYDYVKIGSLSQWGDLAAIARAIFGKQEGPFTVPNGRILQCNRYPASGLYYVEDQGIKYLEQNPRKDSASAKRVLNGAKILWAIRVKTGEFIGGIEDGEVYKASSEIKLRSSSAGS